jgi:hypothetical protein
MLKKRTRRKLTKEESEGAQAWKNRFVDSYDRELTLVDHLRTAVGLIELFNYGDAKSMLQAVIDRHEQETKELVRC